MVLFYFVKIRELLPKFEGPGEKYCSKKGKRQVSEYRDCCIKMNRDKIETHTCYDTSTYLLVLKVYM